MDCEHVWALLDIARGAPVPNRQETARFFCQRCLSVFTTDVAELPDWQPEPVEVVGGIEPPQAQPGTTRRRKAT